MSMPALNPIEKDVREALQAIARSNPELIARFGAISGIQPTAPTVQRKAIGYIQAPSILGYLAPDVVAGSDRRLVHRVFGDEPLVSGNDVVGFNGEVRTSQQAKKLVEESVEPHGWGELVDNDELKIAASSGINLAMEATTTPRAIVELNKEVNGAAFFADITSYASASHYTTLSGTSKFSDPTSDPLKAMSDQIEFVLTACGARPDYVGLGATVMNELAWHPKILDLLAKAQTLGRGIPVTAQIIAQLLNVNVVVGDKIHKSATGLPTADVWSDSVHLVYVGDEATPSLSFPRFAMTAVSPDFPTVKYHVSDKGLSGGQKIVYADCYRTYSGMKSAGFTFFDCV